MPGVPMVAVFDTAFHQTMPPVAYTYALPYEYYEKDKVRRYGFHGTSHKYVSQRAADMLGKPIEQLKLISCHLGNGSSVTAIDGGKSIDTSMGFTPLAGLPMGTRSGDIDAGILEYLMNKYGMDITEMLTILNKKSGVMGVSGVSSDFRDLEEAFKEGNERAGLAVDMFNYGVKKLIGAYAAAMGGVDAIIFTAGVGENSASQRMAIASDLEFMGVKMDEDANKVRGEERVISAPDSKVTVLAHPHERGAHDRHGYRGAESAKSSTTDYKKSAYEIRKPFFYFLDLQATASRHRRAVRSRAVKCSRSLARCTLSLCMGFP